MSSLDRSVICFVVGVWAAINAAGAPNQFEARYVPFGLPGAASGSADLLAVDQSSNSFIIGTVTELWGEPQIRVVKTDSQGNFIAKFDFGGSTGKMPDVPSGASVDGQEIS